MDVLVSFAPCTFAIASSARVFDLHLRCRAKPSRYRASQILRSALRLWRQLQRREWLQFFCNRVQSGYAIPQLGKRP